MTTYFGQCNSADGSIVTDPYTNRGMYADYCVASNPAAWTLTCPGSGNQEIKSLAAYAYNAGASARNFKMAVYSNDKTTRLILTGAIAIAGGANTYAWREATGLSGVNLVGGTAYILAMISNSDDLNFGANDAGPVQPYGFDTGHTYTSPPPDLVGFSASSNYLYPMFRCGVEAAGGSGPVMPVFQNYYSQMRH